MGQFSKVLLTIDNVHIVQQKALDCGPGLLVLSWKLYLMKLWASCRCFYFVKQLKIDTIDR